MEVRQRVVKARTKATSTPALYELVDKYSKDTSNDSVGQTVSTSRVRSDKKSKGVAVRKK